MVEGNGDWWKYAIGALGSGVAFIIKDAVRDATMKKDLEAHAEAIDTNKKAIQVLRDSIKEMPCATEILCLERRKTCNDAFRRELDQGAEQFADLKGLIQANHNYIIGILMEIKRQ